MSYSSVSSCVYNELPPKVAVKALLTPTGSALEVHSVGELSLMALLFLEIKEHDQFEPVEGSTPQLYCMHVRFIVFKR